MKVLVTAASRHGATMEIARAIGEGLIEHHHEASVMPVEEVATIEGYAAVVVGSALYAGWLKPAKRFVESNADALRARPVWLFSSGPLGDPLKPEEDPAMAAPMVEASGARDHRVFAGKLDKGGLNLVEKAMVKAVHAVEGDYRDWDEVRAWAFQIADALHGITVA
jgi:menaquinone-dependent protoporphyrinogen oxidase